MLAEAHVLAFDSRQFLDSVDVARLKVMQMKVLF